MGQNDAYRLRLGNETPVDQRLPVLGIGTSEPNSIRRNDAQVAIVHFLEAASLNKGDAVGSILGQARCYSQTSSATTDNNTIEIGIQPWYAEGGADEVDVSAKRL